jgi:hypothetical protein
MQRRIFLQHEKGETGGKFNHCGRMMRSQSALLTLIHATGGIYDFRNFKQV